MNVRIDPQWRQALAGEFEQPYFKALTDRIRAEYADPRIRIYPPAASIFAAFDASPFLETKVVIIGQDPYHGPDFVFPSIPESRCLLRYAIYSKKSMMTRALRFRLTEICHAGHVKGCFC